MAPGCAKPLFRLRGISIPTRLVSAEPGFLNRNSRQVQACGFYSPRRLARESDFSLGIQAAIVKSLTEQPISRKNADVMAIIRAFQFRRISPFSLWSLLFACLIGAAATAQNRDWPVYGGAPEGTHYSPLGQINRSNVKQLQVAWTYDTEETGGLQTSPL